MNHQIQILKRSYPESLEIIIARKVKGDECGKLRMKDA
jgi:hypothetical protein